MMGMALSQNVITMQTLKQYLFLKYPVEGPVLLHPHAFIFLVLSEVEWFLAVKSKPLTQVFWLIVKVIDLQLTLVDVLGQLLDLSAVRDVVFSDAFVR